MADAEEQFVERALGRIFVFTRVLSVGGTAVAGGVAGWRGAAGFLVGAAAAYLNFYWLHRMAEALGGGRRPRKWMMVFIALRYLLLGLGGYVIVRFFGFSVIGVLTGIFVPVAAVIVEIGYELFYARS